MIGEKRRAELMKMLRREGSLSLRMIKERFQVSPMTIGRDLDRLEQDGLLRRVHGGAILIQDEALATTRDSLYDERASQYPEQKEAIGRLAASLVQDGQYIFLDGSSTVVQMCRFLGGRHELTVVTDSLAVLQALAGQPGIEVLVLGGSLQADRNTIDGPFAVENAERIQVDAMFFSCTGFDMQSIYNAGLIGTNIKRMLIQRARRRILLANAEKFGQQHFFHICSWNVVDILVSDNKLSPEARQVLQNSRVEVLLGD